MTPNDAASGVERADLSNWRTSPFNRSAFHSIRDLIPCADVENTPGDAWTLPVADAALNEFRLRLPSGSSLTLQQFLQATANDGMVILHQGRIVHEAYANGTSEHTPHILMSATKAVVGLLAEMLQPQTLFAMGIHGQNLFVDRANRLVIAKVSSQANSIDAQAIWLTHQAVPEIRRCLTGR